MEKNELKPVPEMPKPPTEWKVVVVGKNRTALVPDRPIENKSSDQSSK